MDKKSLTESMIKSIERGATTTDRKYINPRIDSSNALSIFCDTLKSELVAQGISWNMMFGNFTGYRSATAEYLSNWLLSRIQDGESAATAINDFVDIFHKTQHSARYIACVQGASTSERIDLETGFYIDDSHTFQNYSTYWKQLARENSIPYDSIPSCVVVKEIEFGKLFKTADEFSSSHEHIAEFSEITESVSELLMALSLTDNCSPSVPMQWFEYVEAERMPFGALASGVYKPISHYPNIKCTNISRENLISIFYAYKALDNLKKNENKGSDTEIKLIMPRIFIA